MIDTSTKTDTKSISDTIAMIDTKIVNIIQLANKYPAIIRVGVFGSYARGEEDSKSDIDILYDHDEVNEDNVLEIVNYSGEIDIELEKLGLKMDYVPYRGIMNAWDAETRENILQDVVWVYER